jgi:predicted enzyme related to lactoylglutathione lyase
MPERTSYAAGTPCWVDLTTPDVEAAADFYGPLFGWTVPELPNSAEMGGYRRAKADGRDVAGVYPLMQEGQPTFWGTHVSVADAEATARTVRENGGTMIAEPMQVAEYGKLAVFTDPTGAFFGVWQPIEFAGAELVNEPGALAWNELNTRDLAAAKEFYGAVFGWTFDDVEFEGMGSYTTIVLGEQSVGGILDMEARGVPEMVPAHWQVYFSVDDTDASIEKAKQGGGSVMVEPMEVPAGRFAIRTDPQGASFAVIALSAESQENA